MQNQIWMAVLDALEKISPLLAQGRFYEWRWEMHPMDLSGSR